MAVFSWQRWLRQLSLGPTKIRRRDLPRQLGTHEHLEARTLLSGISLIKDIAAGTNPGIYSAYYGDTIVNANGTLFFLADDGTHGSELWKSNGTEGGTALVADLTPGVGSSYIYNMTAVGGKVIFDFNDGVHGKEKWISDGTENGTQLLKDINPNGGSVFNSENERNLAVVDGTLFFVARDGVHGAELWKTNGTEAGTVMVSDLTTGNNYDSNIFRMTAAGNQLFFVFNDSANDKELWVSNGTDNGTHRVKDINPTSDGLYDTLAYGLSMVNVNGTVYFVANDGTNGAEIWKSNGTEAGTVMVTNINADEYSYFHGLSTNGNLLFFVFDDGTHGYELWSTNGTPNGTQLVKDINPTGDGLSYESLSTSFVNVGGTLYFVANDGVHGRELWKSDGTEAGTLLVADLTTTPNSAADSYLYSMTASGGLLYFGFNDGTHGLELWQSNGTAAGTVLVQDLNPNGDGFYAAYYSKGLIDLNGSLVFLGDNGQTGVELFKTFDDGQPQPPTFAAQSFSLPENAQDGAVVGTLVASDPNGGATLQYTITAGNDDGIFQLNQSTGQLTVADSSTLDFETTSSYTLTVQVKNAANLTTTAAVTINLTDVNEAPVLTPSTFDLDVNSPNGTLVGTVTATDPDAGQQLTYSITNGNTNSAFAIDPATGEITVADATALDLNTNPVFNLSVEVTDNGVPPKVAITTVTINLFAPNDQNDPPVLALNGGPVSFSKKSPPVAIAPNVTVVDPDQSVAFRIGGGTLTVSIDLAVKKKKIFDTIGGLTNVNAIGTIVSQNPVNGRAQIVIQLHDSTTAAAVQNYLRSLTFSTTGAGFKKTTRTIQAQVTDHAGATSNLLQQTIHVSKKPVV